MTYPSGAIQRGCSDAYVNEWHERENERQEREQRPRRGALKMLQCWCDYCRGEHEKTGD